MRIVVANPRGFCAGVQRAIDIVELALKKFGAPIYVKHEIVHNKFVVNSLKEKGVVFVEDVNEVPHGSVCIFSAHGVSNLTEAQAKERQLSTIDATCPLVKKVHRAVIAQEQQGRDVILIGHRGHPEMEGTSGRLERCVGIVESEEEVSNLVVENANNLAYSTQTTLSIDDTRRVIDALKAKFPSIVGPDINDICYATQNRQNAVKDIIKGVDLLLVIGSRESSNSNRLRDIGDQFNIPAYLIDGSQDIKREWFEGGGVESIGITAGASAPEELVQGVIDALKEMFKDASIETWKGITEDVVFHLPRELKEFQRERLSRLID